ncbi:MAG: hypothetical protein ABFD64_04435 [Armatimonadota bacterium]
MTKKSIKAAIYLVAITAVTLPSFAASLAHYTLYYLDQTHNINRILLDSSGKPFGKPHQMTNDMAVDDFSVSPDEKTIIGLKKTVSGKKGQMGTSLIDADVFVWHMGRTSRWPQNQDITMFQTMMWPGSGKYVAFVCHDILGFTWYRVFTTHSGDMIAMGIVSDVSPLSPDERFIISPVSMESHFGSVLKDLKTNDEATIFQPVQWLVWIGNSGKAAWVYDNERILIGGPVYTNGKLELRMDTELLKASKTRSDPANLRYVKNKGLYFTMRVGKSEELYISKDLKTYTKVGLIHPKEEPLAMQVLSKTYKITGAHSAEYSPDRKFIAYSVQPNGTLQEEIRITLTTNGKSGTLSYGSSPHWKSPANQWNPYGTDFRNN